jgi:hypothetical protein
MGKSFGNRKGPGEDQQNRIRYNIKTGRYEAFNLKFSKSKSEK